MVESAIVTEMVFFRRVLLLALLASASASLVRADSPTVTAVLTSSETEVDQPVQLQIKVTGDANATPPNDISVDGLDIRYSGQSQLVEGRNLRFTYSFIYNYTILPLKAGTFTIPPQVVRSASGVLRTPPLTLNVSPNENGTTSLDTAWGWERARREEHCFRRADRSQNIGLCRRSHSGRDPARN